VFESHKPQLFCRPRRPAAAHLYHQRTDPTLPLQERIATLEEEKLLKTKVETLMALMGK